MTKIDVYILCSIITVIVIIVAEFFWNKIQNRKLNQAIKKIKRKNLTHNFILRNDVSTIAKSNFKSMLSGITKLSLPDKSNTQSNYKLKLTRAGFRENRMLLFFFTIKSILFLTSLVIAPIVLNLILDNLNLMETILFVLMLSAVGYYLPDILISNISKKRSEEFQKKLPQFIDLLVVCVESGMSIESALNRVTSEMIRSSKIISEEFKITMLEINSGYSREEAFNNLIFRVNNNELKSMVTIINQVQKTGTNLGDGLRVLAESIRVKKLQNAEEMAAQVSTKMLIPLVIFMFPSLLIVILGPAIIMTLENF